MHQKSRAFIDPEVHPFPIVVRAGKQHLGSCQLPGRFQPGDIQIGNFLALIDLFCPNYIFFSPVAKHRGVQREIPEREFVIVLWLKHTELFPWVRKRIVSCTPKHIRPQLPPVFHLAGREIDVPRAVHPVKLRGPYMLAHGTGFVFSPNCDLLRPAQTVYGGCPPEDNSVILRDGRRKVIHSIRSAADKRVCPFVNKRGVVIRGFEAFLIHKSLHISYWESDYSLPVSPVPP